MRASTSLGFLAIAALIAAAPLGVAHSADLAVKAPPPPAPPPPSWTGCYIGVEAGYGWGQFHDSVSYNPPGIFAPASAYSVDANYGGGMGGPQIGCDYQWGTQWLVGVVATYDFADMGGSFHNLIPGTGVGAAPGGQTHIFYEDVDGFGTVRGRIGWLFAPNWLVYGSGGLAYGRINTSANSVFAGATFTDQGEVVWKTGWTAGGGVEWKFNPHISVFAEYLYAELGSVTGRGEFTGTAAFAGDTVTDDYGRPKINVVKAGINWRY